MKFLLIKLFNSKQKRNLVNGLITLSLSIFTLAQDAQAKNSLVISGSNVSSESSTHSYNFGTVGVNTAHYITYTVSNSGNGYLQFLSANIWGGSFNANHNCFHGLAPHQRCQFQIQYWPHLVGMDSGQFEIRFRPESLTPEVIRVHLWGQATP